MRELIARYRSAYKTNRFINVIQDLVYGYNHTYHSFLKTTPYEATKSRIYYLEAISKRIRNIKPLEELKVGDRVRLKIKRKTFDKASSMIRWSTTIHKIESIDNYKYKVNNRAGLYKRDELKKLKNQTKIPSSEALS